MKKVPAVARGKGYSHHPSPQFSITKLLLDVTFARILLTLLSPFRSFVAWQLFCGRSVWSLALAFERYILQTVGWVSSPVKSRLLQNVFKSFIDIRRWHIAAALLVLYSALSSAFKAWKDSKNTLLQQKRVIHHKMAFSKSYFEWSIHAAKLDALDGIDQDSRWSQETRLYDRRLLEGKVAHLRKVRMSGAGVEEQMFAVRADLLRNLGNITNSALHQHFPVIPGPIREYIEEVRLHLEQITYSQELPLASRAAFLRETRHAFGRTALVLSGGGPIGVFHLGVVKALLEHGMLPRVLAGSGVGAVVCALAATRSDTELTSLLDNIHTFELSFFSDATATHSMANYLFPGGGSQFYKSACSSSSNSQDRHKHADGDGATTTTTTDTHRTQSTLIKRLRHLLGDLTFLEAYTRTGRVLSISVADADAFDQSPRLLNYLTAPHVVVWSAVACSSSWLSTGESMELVSKDADGEFVCFAAENRSSTSSSSSTLPSSPPDHHHQKSNTDKDECAPRRWKDGFSGDTVPLRGLSEMFSVNHFIVSQTSPHIVPLLNLKKHMGTLGQLAETEFKHRCRQLSEILPAWMSSLWLKRFGQCWEGDVTIVPTDALLQMRTAFVAASQADLLAAVRQGEVSTWAKLSAIQANCGVESTLDACIQTVSAWERSERQMRQVAMMPLKARLSSLADVQGLVNAVHAVKAGQQQQKGEGEWSNWPSTDSLAEHAAYLIAQKELNVVEKIDKEKEELQKSIFTSAMMAEETRSSSTTFYSAENGGSSSNSIIDEMNDADTDNNGLGIYVPSREAASPIAVYTRDNLKNNTAAKMESKAGSASYSPFSFECTDATAGIKFDFSQFDGNTPRSVDTNNNTDCLSMRNSLDYIAP